jgi:hypothetical protein
MIFLRLSRLSYDFSTLKILFKECLLKRKMKLPSFIKLKDLYDGRLQEWKKLNKELLASLSAKEIISGKLEELNSA